MESLSEPKLAIDGEAVDGPLFRGFDADSARLAPVTIENRGDRPLDAASPSAACRRRPSRPAATATR